MNKFSNRKFVSMPFFSLAFSAVVVTCSFSTAAAQPTTSSHAIVPGYERFRSGLLSESDAGRLLISELNCQSCHGSLLSESMPGRKAPILTDTANRISPQHLKAFLTDPQTVKPGTAMPDVLHGVDSEVAATALTHFLAASGNLVSAPVSIAAVQRGEALFHSVGCAACHGDQRQPVDQRPDFAMPLGTPDTKYTVGSLITFLQNPHAVRPSGRMPSLNLNNDEARDIANYLLQDIKVEPTIEFEMFAGRWEELPDFDILEPQETGVTSDFDVLVTSQRERFALRFTTFLHVPQDGNYQIWLGSDDGSGLLIDDQQVAISDGVHPHTIVEGKGNLKAGPHSLVVEYFEGGGEESLSVEIAGPGVDRQPLAGLVSQSAEPIRKRSGSVVDSKLVETGRKLFDSAGCAACHQHAEIPETVREPRQIPSFADLNLNQGCLADDQPPNIPRFALTAQQRSDIAAAVRVLTAGSGSPPTSAEQVASTLLTLNCYACHQRDKVGGVPRIHDGLFTGTIPEMGDEGRIPPHLDGIGDKLKASWLKHVMQQGAKDRPYMATRMPKFGEQNVGPLADVLAMTDQKSARPEITFDEPDHRVIAQARRMVGDQALSCIKCHYFGPHKATGIQSLDLTTMTRRLRRDWFHRYLLDPQSYRPGTRMPSAWPNGRSVVPKILHGDPAQQIEAIWKYLQDGSKAKIPTGLIAKAIELIPTDRPVIYRNFLDGLSPRGIAVGFPQKAHFAWDAEQMNLRLIWHGSFIDASQHWAGRGQGNQTPLGDHVMSLVSGQPLAVLADGDQPWPSEASRDAGFQFRGYQLDPAGYPAFRFTWQGLSIVDRIEPVTIASSPDPAFIRTLQIVFPDDSTHVGNNLYYRVASGATIQQQQDGWLVNNAILLKFIEGTPVVRRVAIGQELLVPLTAEQTGRATIAYEMVW